jgi:hypothetical protein
MKVGQYLRVRVLKTSHTIFKIKLKKHKKIRWQAKARVAEERTQVAPRSP